jgi:hypothetical protein
LEVVEVHALVRIFYPQISQISTDGRPFSGVLVYRFLQ